MTRGPTVALVGARKMRKELKKAGFDMAELREPHAAAARVVSQAAGPRTPRRTGKLASSVRSSGTRTAGIVRAGKASVPYANPIHWGWPARNIGPQPWLSETAQRTEPQWLPQFLEHMNRILATIHGSATAGGRP